MAELAAGPHATDDRAERARRQERLQRAEATFEPLPVDAVVARAYGRVYAALSAAGRKTRGPRAVDLLIAATALAAGLPLYTRNPDDSPASLTCLKSSRFDRATDHACYPRIAWELRHDFTAYDAMYVAVAESLEVPLVTCDGALSAASSRSSGRIELISTAR